MTDNATAQQIAQATLNELYAVVTTTKGPSAAQNRYLVAKVLAEHSEDLARLRALADNLSVPVAVARSA